jgi:phospholipase C
MTQLPQGVGHSYKRVTTQLSKVIPGPNGGFINSPEGFVKDFIDYVEDDSLQTYDWKGVVPDDCLGYYDGTQLPVYEYLARNYAYCDRFFCSHPGPTLPNRQFALTGDVDYDRVGVPILENNHGDNFQLSRAQTIIDVLEKRGVSWRVYESAPSVAMLRMFARYASNTDRIRPVGPDPGVDPSATETLEADLAANGLPSFCIIEPAMHHHPQDDDHPDADMWRGQRFIWRVYKALRALPTWERTLLIITYDEHGGLYDHVIPPLAEILDAGITGWGASGQPVIHDGFEEAGEETDTGTGTGTGGWLGPRGVDRYGPGDGGPTTVATGEETDPAPEPDRRVAIPYGVRVPTFLVSPWVPAGRGPSEVYDFCSILKTVLARFTDDRPFMSDRVTAARSLEAYLSEPTPRVVAEEPPEPALLSDSVRSLARDESAIVTPPLRGRDMRAGPVESHEIMGHAARLLGR